MLSLYFTVFFFIIIFNLLLSHILSRQKVNNLIFKKAKEAGLTTINCKYGAWFIVSKNLRHLDIEFIKRDNDILDCEKHNPSKSDRYISCGNNGLYNNKNHICYSMMSELLFNL